MKVYIAGPYTEGDVAHNIRQGLQAAERVYAAGHKPFVPHLYHFWHCMFPHEYEYWTRLDMLWLEECDVMIRLDGTSTGVDDEEDWMREHGRPVYYSTDSFLAENLSAVT